MARDAAERRGVFVVHFTDKQPATPRIPFGRRDSPTPQRRGTELDLFQNLHLREHQCEALGEWNASIDDEAEEDEVEVAVDRLRARRIFERFGRDGGLVGMPSFQLAKEGAPHRQAGAMREEIAQGDVSPVGAAPFGDMSGDGVVERQHAALDLLHHDRCGRDHLGKRREIEDGVVRGRSGVDVECEPAERLSPEDLASGSDLDDGARKGALSDRKSIRP